MLDNYYEVLLLICCVPVSLKEVLCIMPKQTGNPSKQTIFPVFSPTLTTKTSDSTYFLMSEVLLISTWLLLSLVIPVRALNMALVFHITSAVWLNLVNDKYLAKFLFISTIISTTINPQLIVSFPRDRTDVV